MPQNETTEKNTAPVETARRDEADVTTAESQPRPSTPPTNPWRTMRPSSPATLGLSKSE